MADEIALVVGPAMDECVGHPMHDGRDRVKRLTLVDDAGYAAHTRSFREESSAVPDSGDVELERSMNKRCQELHVDECPQTWPAADIAAFVAVDQGLHGLRVEEASAPDCCGGQHVANPGACLAAEPHR